MNEPTNSELALKHSKEQMKILSDAIEDLDNLGSRFQKQFNLPDENVEAFKKQYKLILHSKINKVLDEFNDSKYQEMANKEREQIQ